MHAENSHDPRSEHNDVAAALKVTIARLQDIGDQHRASEAVYGWLKQANLVVHEDGAEQLVGIVTGMVARARDGQDQPTDAQVRAALEAGNQHAKEHNASPRTTTKLRVLDLSSLPDILVV